MALANKCAAGAEVALRIAADYELGQVNWNRLTCRFAGIEHDQRNFHATTSKGGRRVVCERGRTTGSPPNERRPAPTRHSVSHRYGKGRASPGHSHENAGANSFGFVGLEGARSCPNVPHRILIRSAV